MKTNKKLRRKMITVILEGNSYVVQKIFSLGGIRTHDLCIAST